MKSEGTKPKLLTAPVLSNRMVAPGIFILWFKAEDIASTAQPGQFVMAKCDGDNERVLRRPFGIHRIHAGNAALLYSVIGAGTRWLSGVKEGEEIDILGPLGHGFTINPATKHLLLVAGGLGLSPLLFLAMEAVNKGLDVTLLLGASTKTHLCPVELLPEKVETVIVTEDGSIGKKRLVTEYLPSFIPGADQICACGPVNMYKAIEAQRASWHGKSLQVSLETRMGCGIGACFGCTINTRAGLKRVCRDGPVFELKDVLWSEVKI